jgi:hypothetical protein
MAARMGISSDVKRPPRRSLQENRLHGGLPPVRSGADDSVDDAPARERLDW